MKCTNCNDTGMTSSGYLDCTKCEAANTQVQIDQYKKFVKAVADHSNDPILVSIANKLMEQYK